MNWRNLAYLAPIALPIVGVVTVRFVAMLAGLEWSQFAAVVAVFLSCFIGGAVGAAIIFEVEPWRDRE
jgi:hypothetical protein